MSSNDRWNLNRVGQAAAVTTIPSAPPAYGLAYDLGTGTPTMSTEQYQSMMRDLATRTARQDLTASPEYQAELTRAQSLQQYGIGLTEKPDLVSPSEAWRDPSLEDAAEYVMAGWHGFTSLLGEGASFIAAGPQAAAQQDSDNPEAVAYATYRSNGGILTEDDFNSFDEATRERLVSRQRGLQNYDAAHGVPILGPALTGAETGLGAAYRGLQVPFTMVAEAGHKNPMMNFVDPMWFDGGAYAKAWRESQRQSLGNAIVNSVLEPYVGSERIDQWRRDSALYDLTSLGVEVGAGWYADAGVVGGKTIGGLTRLKRGELPLNENSRLYRATTQALQREQITVRGPASTLGKWRAGSISARWGDVGEYAKTHTLSEFLNLPMFRKRDIAGSSAGHALYYALREAPAKEVNLADFAGTSGLTYPDMPTLTQQLLHGDPKAWQDLNALNAAAPEELLKFAPNARSFLDAIDATRTQIKGFQDEADDLAKIDPKSPFHDWSIHTEIDKRQRDIAEAEETLKGYQGYATWLDRLNEAPKIERVGAPKRGFFMDNQFGIAKHAVKWTKPVWIQRANVATMHDTDSGVMSLRRQHEQFEHLFGYSNPEALDRATRAWLTAETNFDRYRVMNDFEAVQLPAAAAKKFGISEETAKRIIDHINAKQNEVKSGLLRGQNSLYSTTPSTAGRVADPADDSISLVSHDPDTEMVRLRLKESGGRFHDVTVHESALASKVTPVDPTQTPNYYQPLDTRRFYLEMKRHDDVIALLDHPATRHSEAALADAMDWVGTKFNALWKPAVLFRFGWPMRVLMDEHMRAMAVLGIPNFFRYHATDAARAANNATVRMTDAAMNRLNLSLHEPALGKRIGRSKLNIGPGPLADAQRRTTDPAAFDQELVASPRVPESYVPALDDERYAKVADHIASRDLWERARTRRLAAEREGSDTSRLRKVERPQTAMDKAFRTHKKASGQARVYDPTTGNRVKSGWVVPLPHTKASFHGNREAWYRQHRELLGSTGHRIYVDAKGNMYVARVWSKRYEDRARALAEFVESPHFLDLSRADQPFTIEPIHTPEPGEAADILAAERGNAPDLDDLTEQFDRDIDTVLQKLLKRRVGGTKEVIVKSADGTKVRAPSAYEGHHGELMRDLISSKGTMEELSGGYGSAISLFRRNATGHKAYQPPVLNELARTKGTRENREALEYFRQWSHLLNTQIAHSPIWSRMLKGESDAKIAHWLDHTTEGAHAKREVKPDHQSTELWVNEHRAKLDYYLPSKKLQRLLGKGRVDASALRKEILEEDYPTVFGPDIEILDRRSASGRIVKFIADRLWHSLGTLPIDTLSRHPFARAMYDLKMRSLIGSTDSKWLDEAAIQRYERQSRNFARDQVRRTLWDLTDQTNFADALRFIAPFWGAQSEAIIKWARIVSDRPETIARFFNLQRAVYNNFVMLDEEGNKVDRGYLSWHPTDRVAIRIPEVMRHGPLGKALMTVGSAGIPLGSANTILQGEQPILPGPGPLITVPADKLLRLDAIGGKTNGVQWDENDLYRWLFPIGRPQHGGIKGVLDQVAPGWSKRVMQLSEGDDGIAYSNLMTDVAREMTYEAERRGEKPPTLAEIEKQAKWLWGLRIVTGLVSPVQTQFRPKHQLWIDEAHRYQQEYGLDWFDKFVEKYGLAASRYATSSTNSTVGVPPTTQGMEEWAENRGLIQQYQKWGDAIISPDAYNEDFSSDAYYMETQLALGPGSSTKLREPQDMSERFAKADARAGWYEFRKVDAILDAQLEARGLHSLSQTGAEDLAQIKQNFIADLTSRNKAWRAEYDDFNNDIYSRVDELEQWAFLPQFDKRPDIQGVRQYLMIRDQVATELDRYAAATGGSRSLQAQENAQLRDWFYQQVGALAQANPAFAEFYSRYLSQDTLTQGSGGF